MDCAVISVYDTANRSINGELLKRTVEHREPSIFVRSLCVSCHEIEYHCGSVSSHLLQEKEDHKRIQEGNKSSSILPSTYRCYLKILRILGGRQQVVMFPVRSIQTVDIFTVVSVQCEREGLCCSGC